MKQRIVEINLGDWYGAGHRISEKIIVELRGEDLSDETLSANYTDTSSALSIDLRTVCCEYKENSISAAFYEQLLEMGFEPDTSNPDPRPFIEVTDVVADSDDQSSIIRLDPVELVMFYVGNKIKDFSWSRLEESYPTLLGGYNTILKQNADVLSTSFGYGLFRP